MKIVYSDPYRVVSARYFLRELGITASLASDVPPGGGPDGPKVTVVVVAEEDAERARSILTQYDLMGRVAR